jgi:hypothetical protein
VGGQSRKMAKPIFGRGLAVRCERSEHGKSQLSKKYFSTILFVIFCHSFFSGFATIVSNALSFSLSNRTALPDLPVTPKYTQLKKTKPLITNSLSIAHICLPSFNCILL